MSSCMALKGTNNNDVHFLDNVDITVDGCADWINPANSYVWSMEVAVI